MGQVEDTLAPLFEVAAAAREEARKAKTAGRPFVRLQAEAEAAQRLVHRAKAEAFARLGLKAGAIFEGHGVRVTLRSAVRQRGNLVEVWVTATDLEGRRVSVDNPYQFVNPPLKHGGVEDLVAAFGEMITAAVARSR